MKCNFKIIMQLKLILPSRNLTKPTGMPHGGTLSIMVHKSETPIGRMFSNWIVLIYKKLHERDQIWGTHDIWSIHRTQVRLYYLFFIQHLICNRNEFLQLKNQPISRKWSLSRLLSCQREVKVSRIFSNCSRKMV